MREEIVFILPLRLGFRGGGRIFLVAGHEPDVGVEPLAGGSGCSVRSRTRIIEGPEPSL